MKRITKDMLKIYKPYSNMDWMNYRLVRKDMTFHHLIKREDGGKQIISNGALLMPIAHQYLHLIEIRDIRTYEAINRIFRLVNDQRYEPTLEQREVVEYLLREFELAHKWDKNSKGDLLIQKKYKERERIL